jgi:hypothetical protein
VPTVIIIFDDTPLIPLLVSVEFVVAGQDDNDDDDEVSQRYKLPIPVDAIGVPFQNVESADDDDDDGHELGGDVENDAEDTYAIGTGRCLGGETGIIIVDLT